MLIFCYNLGVDSKINTMNKRRRMLLVIGCVVVLAGATAAAFMLMKPESQAGTTAKQNKTVTVKQKNGVRVTTSESPSKVGTNVGSTTSSNNLEGLTPATPSGTFVSNHHPNLDGDPAPNQINSICQTTPGVTCEIRFTKESSTKILGASKVGSDGYVSWDWKLQDIGLSEGIWKIEVVAKNGDKTAISVDPSSLEVGP